MTAAPYPADTRAKGWRFEIDVERIEQSDTWTLAPSAIRPWLLMLWMTAWKQTPCGTLTNDDTLIAARIGMTTKDFAKHRVILMRGWWLADDGRLYHATLTERVEAMLEKRTKDTSRKSLFDAKSKLIRERDGGACVYCNARTYLSLDHLIAMSRGGSGEESNLVTACRRCNSVKGARNPDEAGMTFVNPDAERLWHAARTEQSEMVTRYQNGRTREERVADDTKHQAPVTSNQTPEEKRERSPAGSRLPAEWVCPEEWAAYCRSERPELDPSIVACNFADYWHSKAGAGARKADWMATWRTWVRKEDAPKAQGRVALESFRERDERVARERYEQFVGIRRPANETTIIEEVPNAAPRRMG